MCFSGESLCCVSLAWAVDSRFPYSLASSAEWHAKFTLMVEPEEAKLDRLHSEACRRIVMSVDAEPAELSEEPLCFFLAFCLGSLLASNLGLFLLTLLLVVVASTLWPARALVALLLLALLRLRARAPSSRRFCGETFCFSLSVGHALACLLSALSPGRLGERD